ncbi:Uncharacterized protein SCF082_LOCUS7892, partial [Durusdinium trenchii]
MDSEVKWGSLQPKRRRRDKPKSPSALVDCPLCGRAFLASVVNGHAAQCDGAQELPRHDSDSETAALASQQEPRSEGVDAMDIMMRAAAAKPRQEWFVLGADGDCSWSLEAPGESSWTFSASIDMFRKHRWEGNRLGSRVKLRCAMAPSSEGSFSGVVAQAVRDHPTIGKIFSPEVLAKWTQGARVTEFTPGVLKSLLQKSVRRRMQDGALACTVELLLLDKSELFRRLPIVVLEDGMLHPKFDLLVWLMLAVSKGFEPPVELVRRTLEIVHEVACGTVQDVVGWGSSDAASDVGVDELLDNLDAVARNDNARGAVLVRAILFRRQNGGMAGDMAALLRLANAWLRRFDPPQRAAAWLRRLQGFHVALPGLENGRKASLPLAGLDFHVCPWLVDRVCKDTGVKPEEMRSAMWHCEGSVNKRRPLAGTESVQNKEQRALWQDTLLPRLAPVRERFARSKTTLLEF